MKYQLVEILSYIIAIASLTGTFYVILRDNKIKRFEFLLTCYDSIQDAHIKMLLHSDEKLQIGFQERNDYVSSSLNYSLDRELEFACYMVDRNKVDFRAFFYLYRKWLQSRLEMWNEDKMEANAANNIYTVKIINKCVRKKLFPLKNSKEEIRLAKELKKFKKNKHLTTASS